MTMKSLTYAALMIATGMAGIANAGSHPSLVKLLSADFEARQVVQVEVGDFHFKPGQIAPIHTHAAPAVGYVAKGMIIYQVEGEKPQVLRAGDAFYEPVGPRILRFDNASATEEAIFIDFNLEQADEPFIVFEQPPTEAIDRRTLPTVDIADTSVNHADVYSIELAPGQTLDAAPALGLVATGVVEIRTEGRPAQRIVAGASFSLPTADSSAVIVNASPETPATVIAFRIR
jgi:quercetin dioxygenase-like cupin family protein